MVEAHSAIRDKLEKFFDWIAGSLDWQGDVERGDFSLWLEKDFQNIPAEGHYVVNRQGRALNNIIAKLSFQNGDGVRNYIKGTKKILLVSQYAPSLSHAGGLRILDMYRALRERRPDISLYLVCGDNPQIDGDLSAAEKIFDRIIKLEPNFSVADVLSSDVGSEKFDIVDLQFHHCGRMAKHFRDIARQILFTPMECISRCYYDLIGAKLLSEGVLHKSDINGLVEATVDEISISEECDFTICVSDADAKFLSRLIGSDKVDFIPTGISHFEFEKQLSDNFTMPSRTEFKRLIFTAYFGSDTNVAGLRWYVEKIHPLVKKAVPDYDLMVVGRGGAENLFPEPISGVTIIGEVPQLPPVLYQARAGLVLALHGSGFRGKINQYSVCGLPSISTKLGATGLTYTDGVDILLADDVQGFAQRCIECLLDDRRLLSLAEKARQTALENYTWKSVWPRVSLVYGVGG